MELAGAAGRPSTVATTAVPAAGERARLRLDYVDGLRALAALSVVAHHSWLEIWPIIYGRQPSGALLFLTGWLLYGHFAVSVFIVISGYCLMLPVARAGGMLKGGALRFYLRRARRILPPYYLALGVALLLIWRWLDHPTGTLWDLSLPVTPQAVGWHLVLLQDLFSTGKINGVFWSVAVEFRIYFLFPLFVLVARRFGRLALLALAVALPYVYFFTVGQSWFAFFPALRVGFDGISSNYIALFALGMLAAVVVAGEGRSNVLLRERIPWAPVGLLAVAGIVALSLSWGGFLHFDIVRWGILDLLAGIGTVCLLIHTAHARRGLSHAILGARPLVFVGGFAYSIYLLHFPLVELIRQYVVAPLGLPDLASFGLLLLVDLPAVLVAAYLFFLVCERPFMTKSSRPRLLFA